jgi:hypothetical protein
MVLHFMFVNTHGLQWNSDFGFLALLYPLSLFFPLFPFLNPAIAPHYIKHCMNQFNVSWCKVLLHFKSKIWVSLWKLNPCSVFACTICHHHQWVRRCKYMWSISLPYLSLKSLPPCHHYLVKPHSLMCFFMSWLQLWSQCKLHVNLVISQITLRMRRYG